MASGLKRVLVVDDEEDITWSISKSLVRGRRFLQVICVNSGDEALKVFKDAQVDLVISDLRMPGLGGLELLAEIKKHYPSTKVIIMTAYGSAELRREVSRRKGCYYIEKPFELNSLKQLVYDSLDEES